MVIKKKVPISNVKENDIHLLQLLIPMQPRLSQCAQASGYPKVLPNKQPTENVKKKPI